MLELALALLLSSDPRESLLLAAYDETRRAVRIYGSIPDAPRPFPWVKRQKERQLRALERLLENAAVERPKSLELADSVPSETVAACSLAVTQELRLEAIFSRGADRLHGRERAVFARLQRIARHRHLPAFEDCVSRGRR